MKVSVGLCVVFLLLLSGCAAITPPPAYRELQERIKAAPSDSRYSDARTHLQAADEALADRDEAALERFSRLGLIEARIADAQMLQMELNKTMERETESAQQLKKDVALWRTKVETALAEQARLQMRRHIEAVIEKETLVAAAAEELQSHMGDVDEDSLNTARHRVARELVAMADIRTEIAAMMATAAALMPEQLYGMTGCVSLMKQAIRDDDIASVYRYGERNLALFTSSVDSAWIVSGKDSGHALRELHDTLQQIAEGELSTVDGIGYVVKMPLVSRGRDAKLDAAVLELLTRTANVLQNNKRLGVLVVVSGNGPLVKSRNKTKALVDTIHAQLSSYQLKSHQFSVVDFDIERPLRALTGTGLQGALVFFRVP